MERNKKVNGKTEKGCAGWKNRMNKMLKNVPRKPKSYFPKNQFINNFTRLKSVLGHLNPDNLELDTENDYLSCVIPTYYLFHSKTKLKYQTFVQLHLHISHLNQKFSH